MTSPDYSKFIFKSFHALSALGYLTCAGKVIMKDVVSELSWPSPQSWLWSETHPKETQLSYIAFGTSHALGIWTVSMGTV